MPTPQPPRTPTDPHPEWGQPPQGLRRLAARPLHRLRPRQLQGKRPHPALSRCPKTQPHRLPIWLQLQQAEIKHAQEIGSQQ